MREGSRTPSSQTPVLTSKAPTPQQLSPVMPAPATPMGGTSAMSTPYGAASPSSDDPMVGSTVGGFRVVKQLGVGGMGTVYLGEHSIIGSKVAIKVLHPQLASSPDLVQRFFAEARAVNVIGHENIVNIIDLNVLPPNRFYYVMEYLDGKTLQELAKTALPAEVAIPILVQVCEALSAAHAHGIVHRDLKPENIVLIKRGRVDHFVKVLDFGIAKLLDAPQGPQRTASGLIIGTPEFMAPEQASASSVDSRTDIYSLGILTYLIVTGRLPFEHKNIAQLLIAHQTETPKPPREVNSRVPEAMSQVILKAIAKKPEERFQSAAAFREALEAALGAPERPRTPSAVTPTPTPVPSESRHVAPFFARVALEEGAAPVRLRCHDLSRGGVFLCTEGKLPAVFSRLKLHLEAPGHELALKAEVVRHVSPAQGQAWRMPAGFGVQFMELPAETKEQLARLVKGLPLMPTSPPVASPSAEKDDPEAEKVLEFFRKRIQGDHYVVLAASSDADISDIRQRARESRKELERLRERKLSTRQLRQVETALERVDTATAVLGHVKPRSEYDGNRGNYAGVGRCLAAGLSPSELDVHRRKWVLANQRGESTARIHFISASAWEAQKVSQRALEEYERALALDPLNFEYHSRYWSLKRKVAGGKA